jgi:hypothetical protein
MVRIRGSGKVTSCISGWGRKGRTMSNMGEQKINRWEGRKWSPEAYIVVVDSALASLTNVSTLSDLGLMEHRNGLGWRTKPSAYSTTGTIGFPSESRAGEISNSAVSAANVM